MSRLEERIASLTPEQRRLLELRVKKRSLDAEKKRILVPIQPDGTRRPFFCIHSAIGGVGYYVNLARHLSREQPFYGVQSLGLEAEQEPLNSVVEMAAHYVEVIRMVQPAGPYLLGGHSSGGLVAFEMAQQLRRAGQEVALLALLDTQLPARARADSDDDFARMMDEAALWSRLTQAMGFMIGRDVTISRQELAALGTEEQLDYVLEKLLASDALPLPQQADNYPLPVRQLLLRRVLRVFNANYTAEQNYMPQPYAGPLTLIQVGEDWGGAARGEGAAENGTRKSEGGAGDGGGWERFASGTLDAHVVSGNHVTMMSEPHVGEVAERLGASIEAAAGIGV